MSHREGQQLVGPYEKGRDQHEVGSDEGRERETQSCHKTRESWHKDRMDKLCSHHGGRCLRGSRGLDRMRHSIHGDTRAAGAKMMWGEVLGHAVRVRHLSLWLGCG